MRNYKKGFTLIELLVVIAIIGLLSSVVLASLNSARVKGADAAIKSNLGGIRAQAEILYDNASPNSFAGVCTDGTILKMIAAAGTAGNASGANCNAITSTCCRADTNTWGVSSPLKSDNTKAWCVDYTGTASTTVATVTTPTPFKCP